MKSIHGSIIFVLVIGPMINFENTKVAFVTKTDKQLKKAYWLFKLVSNDKLVSVSNKLADFALKIKLPIKFLVKKTVYEQFVGGETIEECKPVINKMAAHKVYSLLDYSVEGKESEEDFNKVMHKVIETIQYANENKNVPFAVFKVTGIARFALLEKISAKKELTEEEELEWQRVQVRVRAIAQAASDTSIGVLVDGEETWIQDAIDGLAEEMIMEYNTENPVVYNTLQMYRTDRLEYLKGLHLKCQEANAICAVKLVRGAYMEKERERARKLNYPSPIQPNKQAADKNFDDAVAYVVQNIDQFALVSGSHNDDSALKLTELLKEKGIIHNDSRIWFSQLYGMSDHLSYNLAKESYNTVKYLPFGPVKETLPYLFRRAEENKSAGGQTGRELQLIEKELKRRKLK